MLATETFGTAPRSNDRSSGRERILRLVRTWAKLQLIALIVWEGEAFLVTTQRNRVDNFFLGRHAPLLKTFQFASINYLFVAVATPFIVALTMWADFAKGRRLRSLALHIVGFTAFVGAHALLRGYVPQLNPLPGAGMDAKKVAWGLFFFLLNEDLYFYLPTVILTVGYRYYSQLRDREVADAVTRSELALAHLQILKMQLQPHFLFNTLHVISSLTNKDPRRARKMISLLSDLLRIAMDYGTTQEVPLKEELDIVGKYLEIERVRFEEALETRFDIPADTLEALVPNLLLQPLVENAVKHGICALEDGGWVSVRSERRDGSLLLTISDNGPGVASNQDRLETGMGLRLTRERLARLYGRDQWLKIDNAPGGGARILISIPFHTTELSPEVV